MYKLVLPQRIASRKTIGFQTEALAFSLHGKRPCQIPFAMKRYLIILKTSDRATVKTVKNSSAEDRTPRRVMSRNSHQYNRYLIIFQHYPLARNQCLHNLPGILSCIRAGANTCAACMCSEIYLCIGMRGV